MLLVTVSTFRRFWVGRRVCALVHRLLALIAKWRAAWRATHLARIDHIIRKGLSAIE